MKVFPLIAELVYKDVGWFDTAATASHNVLNQLIPIRHVFFFLVYYDIHKVSASYITNISGIGSYAIFKESE